MYESFERLAADKKDSIISAALDEFAAKGFAAASTNEIVKNAGISKGALFHYFGDKKALYLFLCDYAAGILEAEYFTPISTAGNDLMQRLADAVKLKMKLLSRFPRLFAFCASILKEEAPEMADHAKKFQALAMESQHKALFAGLDDSLMKPFIPNQEGNKMLWWILEGYSNELLARCQREIPADEEMGKLIREFEGFMALVKQIFYR